MTKQTEKLRRPITFVASAIAAAMLFGCAQPNQRSVTSPQMTPQPAPTQKPAPKSPVLNDPINNLDVSFMRKRAQAVLADLVAALPAEQKEMVDSIPLVLDDTVGEVNASAICRRGVASMAFSDGLLEIQAQLARARATDERFGGDKVDRYLKLIASKQRPKRPIVRPASDFFDSEQDRDARKVETCPERSSYGNPWGPPAQPFDLGAFGPTTR